MSLFVMADLHLSSDGTKSMEVFGARWKDYMNKIRRNWSAVITEDDTVIVPGDISWGLKLEDAREDLLFLESLPGKKLIGKGNHDFWWSTASKINTFFAEHNIDTISLLQNNAYKVEDNINKLRNKLRDEEIDEIEDSKKNYQTSVYYMDIVNELERMGDFIINISQELEKVFLKK